MCSGVLLNWSHSNSETMLLRVRVLCAPNSCAVRMSGRATATPTKHMIQRSKSVLFIRRNEIARVREALFLRRRKSAAAYPAAPAPMYMPSCGCPAVKVRPYRSPARIDEETTVARLPDRTPLLIRRIKNGNHATIIGQTGVVTVLRTAPAQSMKTMAATRHAGKLSLWCFASEKAPTPPTNTCNKVNANKPACVHTGVA